MENNYRELFQKILPNLRFKYPQPNGLEYNLIYEDVEEYSTYINIDVKYESVVESEKFKITNVLIEKALEYEIESIKKLINLNGKHIIVKSHN